MMLKDPDLMRERYLRNVGSEDTWPSFLARETKNYRTLMLTEAHGFLSDEDRFAWLSTLVAGPDEYRASIGAVSDTEWSQYLEHHRAVHDLCMSIKNGL